MEARKNLHLHEWFKFIKGQIVPPFCVEIFLTDGSSHFLNSVAYWEEDDPVVVVRIWDLREFNEKDILALKRKMNEVKDRKEYSKPMDVHTKLDWANMRIPKDCIMYAIEWHDKLWSREKSIQGFHPK